MIHVFWVVGGSPVIRDIRHREFRVKLPLTTVRSGIRRNSSLQAAWDTSIACTKGLTYTEYLSIMYSSSEAHNRLKIVNIENN